MTVDELIGELLVIKDLYICGRLNQNVYSAFDNSWSKDAKKQVNEYVDISNKYVNDSVVELSHRFEDLKGIDPICLEMVLNSHFSDYEDDLFNDMMRDYYGSKDSIAFAYCYHLFSDDFNAILMEVI
jgi:hypothetical protein